MIERRNETDVREEIAVPMLEAMGYSRGSANNIQRELTLTYGREFLGRKKKTDPVLRGRADYVLSVVGAGRWVLEIKAPHEQIDVDAIEQAITYARHPEVSAAYAVLLNGLRLTVHHVMRRANEPALVDLPVVDPISLAKALDPLLSPAAIRRDCAPPIVDLAKPLATGLRSSAEILQGDITHTACRWSSNARLSSPWERGFDEMCRRFIGLRSTVVGGSVHRDENSQIRARIAYAMPHDELARFSKEKGLMEVEYIALNDQLSMSEDHPTVFDATGGLAVRKGESVFNFVRWETLNSEIDMDMHFKGTATGHLEDGVFKGSFQAQHYCSFPNIPALEIDVVVNGNFCLLLRD